MDKQWCQNNKINRFWWSLGTCKLPDIKTWSNRNLLLGKLRWILLFIFGLWPYLNTLPKLREFHEEIRMSENPFFWGDYVTLLPPKVAVSENHPGFRWCGEPWNVGTLCYISPVSVIWTLFLSSVLCLILCFFMHILWVT